MTDPLVDVIKEAAEDWSMSDNAHPDTPSPMEFGEFVANAVREYLDREKHESTVPLRPQEGSNDE